jgi:RNA polymerase sigma-70 factor (ECF subfamily)
MANGDDVAYRAFYDATNGLLFGLLLRILGQPRTAERALSDLYEEIRQNAPRFARFGTQNESPLTWLILIAHRRSIECLCNSRTKEIEIESINITQQRRELRAAIESIPISQRRMIELAFFSGMNNLEIALEMKKSAAAVETELRCGMMLLLKIFRSVYDSSRTSTEPGSRPSEPGSASA